MREAIGFLLGNPEKASRMGENGRGTACGRHCLEAYVEALKRIVADRQ